MIMSTQSCEAVDSHWASKLRAAYYIHSLVHCVDICTLRVLLYFMSNSQIPGMLLHVNTTAALLIMVVKK